MILIFETLRNLQSVSKVFFITIVLFFLTQNMNCFCFTVFQCRCIILLFIVLPGWPKAGKTLYARESRSVVWTGTSIYLFLSIWLYYPFPNFPNFLIFSSMLHLSFSSWFFGLFPSLINTSSVSQQCQI